MQQRSAIPGNSIANALQIVLARLGRSFSAQWAEELFALTVIFGFRVVGFRFFPKLPAASRVALLET